MTGIWRVIQLMDSERPVANVGGGDTNDAYRKEDVMSLNMIISDMNTKVARETQTTGLTRGTRKFKATIVTGGTRVTRVT